MRIPNHIAIIPDGNRRWAKAHRLNPWQGHEEGVRRFWDIAQAAGDLGIKHLSFWAASYDNLTKRSKLEVRFLIKLLRDELSKPEVEEKLLANKIRLRVIGEWREFLSDQKLESVIDYLEAKTKPFKDKFLNILFMYDGKREMLSAVNAHKGVDKKASEQTLQKALWTAELPDVDLVIRTGGEPHWSAGFLMWQTANSQFYFTEMLWPDFKQQELKKAIIDFDRRERRLGK
jgi:undecaprenyl diphosphate synthase